LDLAGHARSKSTGRQQKKKKQTIRKSFHKNKPAVIFRGMRATALALRGPPLPPGHQSLPAASCFAFLSSTCCL
jgi:hypothetical protein